MAFLRRSTGREARPSRSSAHADDPTGWAGNLPAGARKKHHAASTAPTKTCTRESSESATGLPRPISAVAARSAMRTRRQPGGHGRTWLPNRRPAWMASTQRRAAGHPRCSSSRPPIASRTELSGRFSSAHPCSANPMAPAPKWRPATTPRGNTVTTAPQPRQRYRLTRMIEYRVAVPGARGPRSCRSRVPWPTSTNAPPTGRLDRPQHGQCAGLTWSTGGKCSAQNLTPTLE